jgi:hypothetical protein
MNKNITFEFAFEVNAEAIKTAFDTFESAS